MSVPYHDLLAKVSVITNSLVGTDPVELQTTYSTRPLTDELFDSSIFPMAAIVDAIINAEEKLAEAIGFSADRALRAYLRSETAALASGADLPSADVSGNPITGSFGSVLDGEDQTIVLTRMPVALVRNRLLSAGIYLAPAYYYALASGQILHTRSTVVLECCVYNATTQTAACNFNEDMLLPDTMAEAIINGALALLIRDDEFRDQATVFAGYFAAELAAIPKATMEQQAV